MTIFLLRYIDNKAAVDIANAKGLTRRVHHIEIRDAYIRTMRERGSVIIHQISSEENRADLFTKPFGSPSAYIHARDITMMRKHPDCASAGECCDSDKNPNSWMSFDISTVWKFSGNLAEI